MSKLEENHLRMLKKLVGKLPHFDDGRIDFTTSDVAPVINCIVFHKGQILVLQRSGHVGDYQGKWSGVDGYIDTFKPLRHVVLTELREELGVGEGDVADIKIAKPYKSDDKKAQKTWVVYAILVVLKARPHISLDWEHVRYRWIDPNDLGAFDTLPGQDRVLKKALALLKQ